MPPFLLTGFEPFQQWTINSSWEVAWRVAGALGGPVVARRLPVDYHAARAELLRLLQELRPAACLCMGLTPAASFCVERRARKPVQFDGVPGEADLPGAWPWEALVASLGKSPVPVCLSEDAGQYVCESTYWSLLDFRRREGHPARAAFLHVPPLSEQFPVDVLAAAVELLVREALADGPAYATHTASSTA
jgi:pyroglutamyl-peptidase